ncbi:hypothetical protein ACE7GA_07800 [Roseomonas sp. CCTCC AB2023176]|uniref:hypothetical protein n=1 Tax=Roseomonas sp. CCTCC AB2023176 TaxID=3342640 RepID=UPI0035DEFB96
MAFALLTDRVEDRTLAREIASLSGTSPFPLRRALAEGTPLLRVEVPSLPREAMERARELWSVMRVLTARGMRTRFVDATGRDVPPAAVLRAYRSVATSDASSAA